MRHHLSLTSRPQPLPPTITPLPQTFCLKSEILVFLQLFSCFPDLLLSPRCESKTGKDGPPLSFVNLINQHNFLMIQECKVSSWKELSLWNVGRENCSKELIMGGWSGHDKLSFTLMTIQSSLQCAAAAEMMQSACSGSANRRFYYYYCWFESAPIYE